MKEDYFLVELEKLLKDKKIEDIKKGQNCEIDVKLFTNDKIKDIYYTRTSPIKYLK